MTDEPEYTVPESFSQEATDLEDRALRAFGRNVARVLRTISNHDEQELAAAHLMALQAVLAELQLDTNALVSRIAQDAYCTGRTHGFEQLGMELGMLPRPTDAPTITH